MATLEARSLLTRETILSPDAPLHSRGGRHRQNGGRLTLESACSISNLIRFHPMRTEFGRPNSSMRFRGTVKLSGLRLGGAGVVRYLSRMMTPRDPLYAGYRYPVELISYAVW